MPPQNRHFDRSDGSTVVEWRNLHFCMFARYKPRDVLKCRFLHSGCAFDEMTKLWWIALELVDHIHAKEELIASFAVVVAPHIPGVIEAQLRAEENRTADVFGRVESVLGVLAGNTGTLTFLVIEQIRAEAH